MKFLARLICSLILVSTPALALASALAENDSLITFDRALHFTTLEGSDAIATVGQYSIEAIAESDTAIRLRKGAETLTVSATRLLHEESVPHPTSLLISEGTDRLHIVLLLPDRVAFDAVGFFDAVRSRDVISGVTQFQPGIFKQAVQQKATSPALSGAILQISPSPFAELQRQAAQAKAEMEPAALLARIKVLEGVLSCMLIEGYGTTFGPPLPLPRVYPTERADVRWNGIKCPGK